MTRMHAWGFAVGMAIASLIGLTLAGPRPGDSNRRHSIFVAAPQSIPEPARGHLFR